MIKVNTINKDNNYTVEIEGRFDTSNAYVVDSAIIKIVPIAKSIEFDMSKLEYLSSAGLRILLQTAKRLGKDNITIINANDTVKEIFEVTGFNEILSIKE